MPAMGAWRERAFERKGRNRVGLLFNMGRNKLPIGAVVA